MTKLYFIFFLLIFSSIYFGIHYYVYNRIANGLTLPIPVRNCLKIFFLFSALLFLLGEFLSRKFSVYPLIHFGALWLGVISVAFSIFILKDIFGLVFPHHAKLLTYSSLVFVFSISSYALYNASRGPKLREIKIPIKKLPSELSGFSIAQLSDLHLGSLTSKKWLESIVEKTNELKPDLIVITGDLIDQDICKFEDFLEILKRLKSRYGIFAVTGNHEFYAGVEKFMEIAKKLGITVLRNEKITVADSIELVGVDDNTGRRFSGTGSDLKLVQRKGIDLKKPIILLSHQPHIFDEAVKSGVDLQLSGHIHAGQIPPLNLIIMFSLKYPFGLYKKDSSYLYTTSGTGTWGPPMRLFSSSEIVRIILER